MTAQQYTDEFRMRAMALANACVKLRGTVVTELDSSDTSASDTVDVGEIADAFEDGRSVSLARAGDLYLSRADSKMFPALVVVLGGSEVMIAVGSNINKHRAMMLSNFRLLAR